MQEENFTEELLEDVEGKLLDFFLGCFSNTNKEDSFESFVKDGKLYGQDYSSIKVSNSLSYKDDPLFCNHRRNVSSPAVCSLTPSLTTTSSAWARGWSGPGLTTSVASRGSLLTGLISSM